MKIETAMKTAAIIAAAVTLMSSALSGQSTPSTPSFDVASIKLHADPAHEIDISTSGPRLTAKAKTVLRLIAYAYDLKGNYQVVRNPTLLAFGDKMYDIEAEVDATALPRKHNSAKCSNPFWPIDSSSKCIASSAKCRCMPCR